MEHRVTSEFEKYKAHLKSILTKEFGDKLSESDIDLLLGLINKVIKDLIDLMKEGKSVHEKFFSNIILHSVDAIVGLDNDLKVFLWNEGAEKLYGYKKEEILGKDFEILIPEHKLKEGEKDFLINEVKGKGSISNYETDRLTKDGRMINVSLTRFAINDDLGNPIGSVGIVRDLTHVKKLEKELRERENLALIGEVVSSIAHSLSNPLNIISGNADYLLLDKKEGEKEYDELKTILEETTRITKSIRHLLNFSGKIKIHKEPNDIHEVISNVITNSKFITGDKQITFKKNFSPDLNIFIFDKVQIQEVISNIITNSFQAISKRGEVKVKTYIKDNHAMIEISDNGCGIPKENMEKIFQPFYSSKEYGKGTGLGLSITRRSILEHGGNIDVKSLVGKGTTISVSLPLNN